MILGDESLGVPVHGLPELNRYCSGMSPTKFITMGEAYRGRGFNFIITEFNYWFKYKGIVEPLKLAMERGLSARKLKHKLGLILLVLVFLLVLSCLFSI